MDIVREGGGRGVNQLRPIDCSLNVLNRAHGSANCSHGDTRVMAAVYGPKAGTKKNENPEKSSIEVVWKPKTGQIGKQEKEFEMIMKRTLLNICILNVHPNTTTSIIIQVVHDDGSHIFRCYTILHALASLNQELSWSSPWNRAPTRKDEKGWKSLSAFCSPLCNHPAILKSTLLPCAIHAACAALIDAGFPLKYFPVAISCALAENGPILLDPNKLEEKKMKALVYLAFPCSIRSVLLEGSSNVGQESTENGIITSLTHGVMSVDDYFRCLERGRAAVMPLSNIFKKKLQLPSRSSNSVAG